MRDRILQRNGETYEQWIKRLEQVIADDDQRAADELQRAVDVVARGVVAILLDSADSLDDDALIPWSDYPEISKADFYGVLASVREMAPTLSPTTTEYEAAYAYLAERAEES